MTRLLRHLLWLGVLCTFVWGASQVLADIGTESTFLPIVLHAAEVTSAPLPTGPMPTQTMLPSATVQPTATTAPTAAGQACPYPNGSPMADLYCTGGYINTPTP